MSKVFISIPHSGLKVPTELGGLLAINKFDLKNHSDFFTEKIYQINGVENLKFEFSRVLVDPNRFCESEILKNISDDGITSRLTPDGKKVFLKEPDEKVTSLLLKNYYFDFHKILKEKLSEKKIKFLIDGHSMWSRGPSHLKDAGISRSEIILGNRDYTTCNNQQTSFIKNHFEELGYQIAINDPYKGKKIMKEHCCGENLTAGIQIEINRKLYLNEETLEVNLEKIKKLNQELTDLVSKIDSSNLF